MTTTMPDVTRAAVARRACDLLARAYPGTRWTTAELPGERMRLEAAAPPGQVERFAP
jgi:hypothetical protein